jgi:2-hydroxy-3-oxopropionate reductase
MSHLGFIGLGIMGKPMASHLVKAGYRLLVNDINKEAEAALTALGAEAASPAEIGGSCDIIFTILPNGAIVQEVLFGDGGVCSQPKSGSLVIDMSSVTPTDSAICAEKLSAYGIGFLDCPVSGGEPGAINATLAFMCGGSQEDFDRAKPYFEVMGSSAVLIGGTGSGSVTKLANQIIVNMTIAAVSEALVLASKAGADPEKVSKAIRGGLAGSAVLDAKAPMMIARNFKPGGKMSINHKDIKNVVETAHALDVPIPMTSQLYEILQSLKIAGYVDDDHSSIVRYFERLAGIEVGKSGD